MRDYAGAHWGWDVQRMNENTLLAIVLMMSILDASIMGYIFYQELNRKPITVTGPVGLKGDTGANGATGATGAQEPRCEGLLMDLVKQQKQKRNPAFRHCS